MNAPTCTDLFCGAGGSSLGAEAAGMQLVMAANHWETAIEVHQHHFPDAAHDLADVSQADPRRYPKTDVLLASPECTNHSAARGVSRARQQPSLWDAPDPSAERSRATMWDVPRFAEQLQYDAIVVENVVEATKWVGWRGWCVAMDDLGYQRHVLSHNSMHHGVPQSRDRIYVVFTRAGIDVDLELERDGWCETCDRWTASRQGWKNGRTVGRYRQQWVWVGSCGHVTEPAWTPASTIIDWSLPTPRIGDRKRPLAAKTRARIAAGLARYAPFMVQTAHGGHRLPVGLDDVHPTVTASDDRHSLVVPLRNNSRPYPPSDPLGAVTAGGNHHGLLMRNSTGLAEMVTPVTEVARTMTTKVHQSLLMPEAPCGDVEAAVDECGFRMLQPHEVAAAMAFPEGYIPGTYTKRDQVKLAGNAVTPPVMQWITGRVLQALEAA